MSRSTGQPEPGLSSGLCGRRNPGTSTRAPLIVFDVSLIGFYRYVRKRLKALGFKAIITPYKYDHQLIEYARKMNAIIVTTDKELNYERKIILPLRFKTNRGLGKPKYEKWWTILCSSLHILTAYRLKTWFKP